MTTDSNQRPNLVKYLSSASSLSRRRAADAVKNGEVRLNGAIQCDPSTPVAPGDRVEYGGKTVCAVRKYYILLHKPRGYVCSNADAHAPKLAVDLIRLPDAEAPRLFSAGRLDAESEGMLIFSNDGDYVNQLSHPRYEILKRYRVVTNRLLTAPELARLRGGIRDDGEWLKPRRVEAESAPCTYLFELNEGKKREIRRLVASTGARVTRLIRIQTGRLPLGNLPIGAWRELTEAERRDSLCNASGHEDEPRR